MFDFSTSWADSSLMFLIVLAAICSCTWDVCSIWSEARKSWSAFSHVLWTNFFRLVYSEMLASTAKGMVTCVKLCYYRNSILDLIHKTSPNLLWSKDMPSGNGIEVDGIGVDRKLSGFRLNVSGSSKTYDQLVELYRNKLRTIIWFRCFSVNYRNGLLARDLSK